MLSRSRFMTEWNILNWAAIISKALSVIRCARESLYIENIVSNKYIRQKFLYVVKNRPLTPKSHIINWYSEFAMAIKTKLCRLIVIKIWSTACPPLAGGIISTCLKKKLTVSQLLLVSGLRQLPKCSRWWRKWWGQYSVSLRATVWNLKHFTCVGKCSIFF